MIAFEVIAPFIEVKSLEDGTVRVAGYASTFENTDRHGDIIAPNAFDETMEKYMRNPVLLAFHDHKKPLGKVTEAHIDENGLFVVAEIPSTPNTELAAIRKQVQDGILTTFSIGGYFHREKSGSGKIMKVELIEISVVAIPANPRAEFTVQKAFEMAERKDFMPMEYGNILSEAKSTLEAIMQPEVKMPPVCVKVEGQGTGAFIGYLTGFPAHGRKSAEFSIEANDVEELRGRLQQIEEYVKRTGVKAMIHIPRSVEAWMEEAKWNGSH